MLVDARRLRLDILDTSGTASPNSGVSFSRPPVAAVALPRKINAARDIVVLTSGETDPTLVSANPDFAFNVTTTNDEDDAGACPNTSTLTNGAGADGVLSLREAVCEANNNGSVSSLINVPAGTYPLLISTYGGNGSVYSSGELQLGTVAGANISLVGTGTPSNTIINQTDGVDRVLEQDQLLTGSVAVSLSNLTMAGGTPTTGIDAAYGGGAVLGGGNAGDDLELTGMVMTNNTTVSAGPGGAIGFSVANLTVINSVFSDNFAAQSAGGACACGSNDGQGNLVFTNSTFTNNIVTDASTLAPPAVDSGGALALTPGTGEAATISGSTFTGNQAQGNGGEGGAVAVDGVMTLSNSRMVGNSAAAGSGLAVVGGSESEGTFSDNWWGCNAGPGNAGCDSAFVASGSGAMGIGDPWLVLGISASQTQVLPNAYAALTADLTHDSSGAGGFSIPDGTSVAFGGALGTENPTSAATVSGQATSTFTAGVTSGAGSAKATVDNQTAGVSINIGAPPSITNANNTTFTVGSIGSFTVTATGTPAPGISLRGGLPAGVTFVDNGNGTGTLYGSPGTGGVYMLVLTAQNGFLPNAAQTFTLTVNQPPAITSANNASFAVGSAGSFTATTSAFPTASITEMGPLPNGVAFIDNHNGTGTLSGTPAATGVFNIAFTASNGVGLPAPQTFALTVTKAATTVALTSSLNPSVYPQSVTFTATVSSSAGIPPGTVTFKDGSAVLGSATLTSGVATLTRATLSIGTHAITAVYGGSATFSASTSSALSQVVSQDPTTVVLASSLNPSAHGQSVTFTATVSSWAGIPPGTVTFKDGSAVLGSATLTSGVATLTRATLSIGTHAITAVYGGSATFSASTSSALSQVVSQDPTTVVLASSLNPSAYGQSVTFTATVSSSAGIPPGTVTFKNGSTALGSATLTSGVATFTRATLSIGTHALTAVYGGSATFSASTSSALSQVVSQDPTTVVLASSLNPSAHGQSVTFTATVSSSAGIPTGTVTFTNGGTGLGNVALAGGTASFTTAKLGVGTASLKAAYLGAANFSASSASMRQVVNPVVAQNYELAATALNPGFITLGNTSTSAVTVTPISGYTGSVSLACNITGGGVPAPTCSVSPASVTISGGNPSTAALTVSTSSSTPAGNYSVSLSAVDLNGLAPIDGSQSLTVTTVPAGSLGYWLNATALNPGFVMPGSASTSTVIVTPINGYTGSVGLSCGVSGAGSPAPVCAFNPSSLTISGANPATAVLSVSTAGGTVTGNYYISVSAADINGLAPINASQALTLSTTAIQHIVIIFQENRTPDNLFQDPVLIARGADIAASGLNSLGQTIALTPIDLGTSGSNPQYYDLGHGHGDFVAMYDGGKMDGANLISCSPTMTTSCPPGDPANPQYRYVTPADVQPYFALAEQYTFGDRMFQTNQGPSFPAHQFIISGTSAPTATSSLFAAENPTLNDAGCIAPLTTLVTMIDATGSEANPPPQYPCFDHPTLTDFLDANGLSWRYYAPTPGSIWTAPDAIEHICQQQPIAGILTCTGPDWNNNVVIPQTRVLTDIANGNMAQVSWVIPDGNSSDHARDNDGSGPSWVASIVNAIGNSSYWSNTAIIITWDDWGGWYDHVAPQVINDGVSWGSGYVYGFRVPLIVVSPYAKAGYISHVAHDFGSILKFIETNFNLPSLGYADAPADNLADCFDFTQAPTLFQAIPAALDASHFLNDKRPPTGPDDD